jgi:hypothetical protein
MLCEWAPVLDRLVRDHQMQEILNDPSLARIEERYPFCDSFFVASFVHAASTQEVHRKFRKHAILADRLQ